MPAYRFYSSDPLKANSDFFLEDLEHRHLKQVMRLNPKDTFEATDGRGTLVECEVVSIEKSKTHARVLKINQAQRNYELSIIQAMPKMNHLEWILEKGTELGMTRIVLFQADHSVQTLKADKMSRLQSILISALKQSGRLFLPTIEVISNLNQLSCSNPAFYGDVSSSALHLSNALKKTSISKNLIFVNGPEAGFSKKEETWMKEKGFVGVSLHHNILRTETAPLAFLSIASEHLALTIDGAMIN